ncbi:hypothetical protein [Micrococcus sp. TA1]|uniref:hypothetical protein n=1 Tax=Micrococcus sp. TA1 TaxID=681627 RepID=UPI001614B5AC|nr:hypothetical protein [Micrococcus sp. TA1]MBB5747801.1 ribose/xylose/arabinose/galactoside ABC-type transport system permease subunit [Micrococcus sp. TA1]
MTPGPPVLSTLTALSALASLSVPALPLTASASAAVDYRAVDFQSPVATLWVAGVLVLVGLAVLGHAVWRRRRHVAYARRTGRNTDPAHLRDTRVEQVVSYLCLAVAGVLAGLAALGAWQTHQNVRGNLAAKYGVTAVDNARWSGAFLVADLTLADGTVRRDATVYFEADGEPLTGEDVFSQTPGA